ncbi:hypothetical protein BH24CHL4_BH24CHL4_10430 [soil metagenome]
MEESPAVADLRPRRLIMPAINKGFLHTGRNDVAPGRNAGVTGRNDRAMGRDDGQHWNH